MYSDRAEADPVGEPSTAELELDNQLNKPTSISAKSCWRVSHETRGAEIVSDIRVRLIYNAGARDTPRLVHHPHRLSPGGCLLYFFSPNQAYITNHLGTLTHHRR